MNLKIIFPTKEYKQKAKEYVEEHYLNNEFSLPGAGALEQFNDYDEWIGKTVKDSCKETVREGKVPATQYFGIVDNEIVGAIQIRHELNDYLLNYGGHIGYGVRPSQRRKGYASDMLRLVLEECKKLNINKVLITCRKENIGSASTIKKFGGILENEVLNEKQNEIRQRYWINL